MFSGRLFITLFAIVLLATNSILAQELFPLTEPASNVPKGVVGLRLISQGYADPGGYFRIMNGLRVMYGITGKWTIQATATGSNHHSKLLPPAFPEHNTPQIGVPLPYRFNGVHLYSKYRFFTKDKLKQHIRLAGYAEYGFMKVAHDEAEPNLMEDTKGFGAGLIATALLKRIGINGIIGIILPGKYEGAIPDYLNSLPQVPATVEYGNAINYSLSFGYRIWPFHFNNNYKQANLNLYMELLGKYNKGAKVILDEIGQPGSQYQLNTNAVPVLVENNFVEIHPGAQLILNSNYRIDASIGFPVLGKSQSHFYPLYSLGLQYYFF